MQTLDNTALKRWKLILGSNSIQGEGAELSPEEQQMDAALGALYEFEHSGKFEYQSKGTSGSSGKSTFALSKWLGDIRTYFPNTVVQVLQKDALRQPELQKRLMFEPEILEQSEPDVHLVAMLMELKKHIPAKTKTTAQFVVKKVVEDLMEKLHQKTVAALSGAINRSVRNRRPKFQEMDWNQTILKNLKHYQPDYHTIIPELKIGFGRKKRQNVKDIILCLDQSASMATSIVYSGVFAAVMASLPSLKTRLIVFDTDVADLTEQLDDPVELLFGIQLGGGTDINSALRYCEQHIEKPLETIIVLISDLFEGGNVLQMQQRIVDLHTSGVQIISLLALSDDGTPSYDVANAKYMAAHNIPVFACTPDLFPDMMAAAINGQDLGHWAGQNDVVLK
jgi:VWA domain containing CoxE-like protein